MKPVLPAVLRSALYRRAVACAWLTACEASAATRTLLSMRWKARLPTSWKAFTCASTARKKAVRLPVRCWRI